MSDEFVPTPEITDDDKLWGLLSYLLSPLVPLIMLLMEDKKNRPFIKYHAVQALILGVVASILTAALAAIIVGCVIGFAYAAYAIYLAVKAYQGEMVEIPFLTNFCKTQGWIE